MAEKPAETAVAEQSSHSQVIDSPHVSETASKLQRGKGNILNFPEKGTPKQPEQATASGPSGAGVSSKSDQGSASERKPLQAKKSSNNVKDNKNKITYFLKNKEGPSDRDKTVGLAPSQAQGVRIPTNGGLNETKKVAIPQPSTEIFNNESVNGILGSTTPEQND